MGILSLNSFYIIANYKFSQHEYVPYTRLSDP